MLNALRKWIPVLQGPSESISLADSSVQVQTTRCDNRNQKCLLAQLFRSEVTVVYSLHDPLRRLRALEVTFIAVGGNCVGAIVFPIWKFASAFRMKLPVLVSSSYTNWASLSHSQNQDQPLGETGC